MLGGKKILLGVCGSIAAYKSALLVRLLVKANCELKVVMTPSAANFITPLTLATLSKNPVYTAFEKNDQGEWVNHVAIGLWADLMVIAPATANTIGKMASGLCDNLLTAIYLSARCPVLIAPAMDLDMYQHPSVKYNLNKLSEYGNRLVDAEYGELASGLVGTGRMAEPEHIFEEIVLRLSKKKRFEGKQILITAGPTYEKIDPVRFIGNHSSGKMGMALAKSLAGEGAHVHLICGPGSYQLNGNAIELIKVTSADDMLNAVDRIYASMDISIFAAAVADYKPTNAADQKIKKTTENLEIKLTKNPDIAAQMGARKKGRQINVGFALETEDEFFHAQQKLKNKNFDLIVLNSLNDPGAGFSIDTNKITIFSDDKKPVKFPVKPKSEVAMDIIDAIYEKICL